MLRLDIYKRFVLQFIESLAPDQHLNISKGSLESVTQEVNCYQAINLGIKPDRLDTLFVLMDTPGFLDPRLSEGRITKMITESLEALRQNSIVVIVELFYFQPITDIRISGSKRDAVKILQGYIRPFDAQNVTVITTMWNQLSTPKQLEDANCRLGTLKKQIYADSDGLHIYVTKFDNSQASALSLLNGSSYGWRHQNFKSKKAVNPQYQSLLCNSLLARVTNLLQQLQLLAEDKQSATCSGSEDHCLLRVVLRDEKVALLSLQSFLDDLASDDFSPSGMMALQSLMDNRYEQDPDACSSSWPLSCASPLAPSIPLFAGAPQPTIASDIPSNRQPAVVSPSQVPGLDQLGITSAPIPSAPHGQPPSPDASCFAPIAAAIKRRFSRTQR
ncbi:hypothetical protein BJ165DRAFT_1532442 [Panaeolus papilionaceus]|nr:hypothetical protein BJ165DRAFT_1532442 [Panaeolus papilionaceus]